VRKRCTSASKFTDSQNRPRGTLCAQIEGILRMHVNEPRSILWDFAVPPGALSPADRPLSRLHRTALTRSRTIPPQNDPAAVLSKRAIGISFAFLSERRWRLSSWLSTIISRWLLLLCGATMRKKPLHLRTFQTSRARERRRGARERLRVHWDA